MQIPANIKFLNVDSSEALESRINQKIERLDSHFPGIISCNVIVESAHHHQRQGRYYSVRVDVTLPKGEVVVSEHPGKKILKHDKIFAAMNSAFAAIEKQLTKFKETQRAQDSKQHEDHILTGIIHKINYLDGFGFIILPSEDTVYFHKNSVENNQFEDLTEGQKIKFILGKPGGEEGPQASLVRLIK